MSLFCHWRLEPQVPRGLTRSKEPPTVRPGACCGLTKSRSCAILFIETGAAGQTVVPRSVTEVTAQWVRQGGYFFLFPSDLNNQAKKANDQNAELNEIGICNHWTAPLSEDRRAKKRPRSSHTRPGDTACRLSAAPLLLGYHTRQRMTRPPLFL